MPRLDVKLNGRCTRCLLQPRYCLCPDLPVVHPTLQILILRHYKEAWSTTNTARLVDLAIPGAVLHDYGEPSIGPIPDDILSEAMPAWLLFPADDEHPAAPPDAPPPRTLVVVDGSWRQARKMVRRLPGLRALPRYSPTPRYPGPDRIRRPPFEGGMATLEAVGRALSALEGEAVGAPLEELFSVFVARIRLQRGY